mgnify:FL=1|jgi:hypothetical protein
MNKVYEKINDPGLVAWVILIQDSQFNSVTPGYCKQYAQTHPMTMRLLYDPSGDTSIYGGQETSIISDESGTIVFEGHSDAPALIEKALIAELTDVDGACWDANQCTQGQYCVPLPQEIDGYEVSVCAELCADDSACPDGKTCEQLQPGNPNGACLTPQQISP